MKDLHLNAGKFDDKTINITVPAKVGFDKKKMTLVTDRVLDLLGCPNCHSGFDLRFRLEREFIFNDKIELLNH